MSTIKEQQRFAELEYCIEQYFNDNIHPVMREARAELTKKQAEELGEYKSSFIGVMHEMSKSINNLPDDSLNYLNATGEWNSKTTDDYLVMCREDLLAKQGLVEDLSLLADEWRNTLVAEIGQERYDELCERKGEDIALAYVEYRIDQLMLDRLAKDKMPKSSMEYIMQKAATTSLMGITNHLQRTDLEAKIDDMAEKAYNPSQTEKYVAAGASTAADVVMTGSSWKLFAAAIGIRSVGQVVEDLQQDSTMEDEQYISQGVFGSNENVFSTFRAEARKMDTPENEYINSLNEKMNRPMGILTKEQAERFDNAFKPHNWGQQQYWTEDVKEKEKKEESSSIPLVVRPGAEQEFLEHQQELRQEEEKKERESRMASQMTTYQSETQQARQGQGTQQTTQTSNGNGWGSLMGSLGLDGLGKIGNNLGYVIAMLPDVIFGLFTGKSSSLLSKNSLLPLASIIGGLFVKNPLLKMMMIGLGGLNLFNKAGKDAISLTEGPAVAVSAPISKYKQYADEPLNPRVTNPQLKGNLLIANIDRVPVTIQLSDKVVKAYQEGALPLNTLINAVLQKNDQATTMAQENYSQAQKETVTRTRGI